MLFLLLQYHCISSYTFESAQSISHKIYVTIAKTDDLGGQVLGMASLDEATLLISVWDNQIMQGSITVYDKRQQSILGQWNAPDMAQLGRIIVQGNQVITSDLQSPNLFVIDLNLADIGSSTFQIIQSLDIVQDLTVIESDEYRHLYVATDQRVDIWDLDEQIWKQIMTTN